MLYNELLANRIREAIADSGEIEEKKMFGGLCFMVNGKMCICVRADEMMCRVGPDEYEAALEKPDTRPMLHNAKSMKGYVFVNKEAIKANKDFDYWINASLKFNNYAKAVKPKKKK